MGGCLVLPLNIILALAINILEGYFLNLSWIILVQEYSGNAIW